MVYLSLKWLHFIGLISWMCGVLYLYRLLVNQAEKGSHPDISTLLTLMSRRLYKYIMIPAMIVTYCAGFGMLSIPVFKRSPKTSNLPSAIDAPILSRGTAVKMVERRPVRQ